MTTQSRGKQKTLPAVPSGGARRARRREAQQGALKGKKFFEGAKKGEKIFFPKIAAGREIL